MIRSGAFKAALAMAGIFLAGAVAGGFAGVAWYSRATFPGRITVDEFADRHLGRMIRDLGLTEEQVTRVRPIMEEMTEQLRVVRRKSFDDARAIFREMNTRIEAELTPEQVQILREGLERMREREGREGPPRRPPGDRDRPPAPDGEGSPRPPPDEKPGAAAGEAPAPKG